MDLNNIKSVSTPLAVRPQTQPTLLCLVNLEFLEFSYHRVVSSHIYLWYEEDALVSESF